MITIEQITDTNGQLQPGRPVRITATELSDTAPLTSWPLRASDELHLSTEYMFEELYGEPVSSPDGNDNHWYFEDLQAHDIPLNRVWSVVEDDEDDWLACSGYHTVNHLFYLVTPQPWHCDTTAMFIPGPERNDEDEDEL